MDIDTEKAFDKIQKSPEEPGTRGTRSGQNHLRQQEHGWCKPDLASDMPVRAAPTVRHRHNQTWTLTQQKANKPTQQQPLDFNKGVQKTH